MRSSSVKCLRRARVDIIPTVYRVPLAPIDVLAMTDTFEARQGAKEEGASRDYFAVAGLRLMSFLFLRV